ncbi:apolipoprotein A-IV-like [Brachyhypopomus gauderio]|uniref:apolipoprotein A-IV-like n=1 Tax=Brachyhypopomus gauderio TaxID=698409 RepID=UPI0040435C52
MKVILLIAIVAFTGCQANLFYADEPKPQLEKLNDAFWDYVAQATHTAEETLKMIKESQLGQEVNARITESANVASEYAVTLQNQINPMVQDIMTKITKEAEVLKQHLESDLTSVKDKLEPYTEDLKAQIQQRVEELRVAVAETTVLQEAEKLKGTLEEKVKELQSQLGPYTDELKQKVEGHLQDFQKTVTHLTEDLQTQVAERAAMVQQSLAPYAEDLKEKLDPYAQNLKDKLTALYESFSKTS